MISVLMMTTGEEKSLNESDLDSQISNVIKVGGGVSEETVVLHQKGSINR